MCGSAWNKYEFPQMNFQAVYITCASSESSFTFLYFRFQFSLLHSSLGFPDGSWWFQCLGKVAEPFRGKRNSSEPIVNNYWSVLGYHLPPLFVFWNPIFSAFLSLFSKRRYLWECWGFFLIRGSKYYIVCIGSDRIHSWSRCSTWSGYKIRLKFHFRNYLKSLQPNTIKTGV